MPADGMCHVGGGTGRDARHPDTRQPGARREV
jgi:hypothetical protein